MGSLVCMGGYVEISSRLSLFGQKKNSKTGCVQQRVSGEYAQLGGSGRTGKRISQGPVQINDPFRWKMLGTIWRSSDH